MHTLFYSIISHDNGDMSFFKKKYRLLFYDISMIMKIKFEELSRRMNINPQTYIILNKNKNIYLSRFKQLKFTK